MNRYSRNILIKEIGEEGQSKLLHSKVLVCGCGGLGLTVIANLAALGIGHIGIVDDDVIDVNNMNKIHKRENLGKHKTETAKEFVESFNPDVDVKEYKVRLDEKNYEKIVKDYEILVDCFDIYKSKFLLNAIAVKTGKTLIHAGLTEFYGQVTTIVPHKTPCLRCILPDENVNVKRLKDAISPAVTQIASIEAMEVIKYILKIGTTLENTLLTYNGLKMEFKKQKVSRNPDCPVCGEKL